MNAASTPSHSAGPAVGSKPMASGIFEDESREVDFVFSLRVALDGVESLIAQASK
jgi:hypothetical protein